jgi:transglutaminase-like putative cysteine protease
LRGEGDDADDNEQNRESGRRDNEELEFRDNYDNAQNRVPVGVVLLHDDYSPPTGVYYLRQGAFSQYNGRRLVGATRGDVDRDIARSFPTSRVVMDDAPDAGLWRGTIETTVALLADHNRPFALEAPVELRPAPNPDPRRFKRMYRATSSAVIADYMSMIGMPVGSSGWSDAVRAHYTEAPDDPRYAELAARIIEELPEDLREDRVARALAVTGYLSREGTYSLRSRHADAEDPTGSFLFGDLTGYCVHFAHAATYLMRTLDVPARVATGYAVDEASRQGGSAILVSGQASHAWPEMYVEDVGWVVADVAPETVISPPPGPPDPDLQRLLAELVRGQRPLPIDGRPAADISGAVKSFLFWAGRGLGGAILVGFALLVLGRIYRRLMAAFARSDYRLVYIATLDTLSAVGIRRSYGESREAFARRVAKVVPSFEALTRGHVGARFAADGPRARLDPTTLFRAVRRELRAAVPWWKRTIGALSPWTWIWSR